MGGLAVVGTLAACIVGGGGNRSLWPYATLRRSTETVSGRPLISRVKCLLAVSRILNGPL